LARAVRGHFLVDTALNVIITATAFNLPLQNPTPDDDSESNVTPDVAEMVLSQADMTDIDLPESGVHQTCLQLTWLKSCPKAVYLKI
jgi:hypothetical protein